MAATEMVALAASVGDIDTSAPLSIFEAYGKVFICNGTKKKVADFVNIKLTSANVAAAADNAPHYGNILTGETSEAKMVVDYITSMTGACTLYGKRTTDDTFESGETVTGTNDDGNAVSFTISANEAAGPHWYNWTIYGGSATYGALPDRVTLGCLWNGRGIISGDTDYPNQWYMSRQGGNMWDFNYISEDKQSPIAGGSDPSTPGKLGDIVVSLIPYNKDYLIFGCVNSIAYMAGNPADGGSLLDLVTNIGLLDTRAYCKDSIDNLYLLTTAGLIRIGRNLDDFTNLTHEAYPNFIEDMAFDPSVHRLTLGYSKKNNGIKISKTTLADGTNECWWYDLNEESKGLFPETYPEECGAYCMFDYNAVDPDNSGLLIGCKDGYIRIDDNDAKDDDIGPSDEAIDSYVTFGPIPLNKENNEGIVDSLVGVTAGGLSGDALTDSNNLTYNIWVGRAADEVVGKLLANTTPNIAGTIISPGRGRGGYHRKKVRGIYAGIRVGNDAASQTWGLERIIINGKSGGRSK